MPILEGVLICAYAVLTRAIFLCPSGRTDSDLAAHLWMIRLRQRQKRFGQPIVEDSLAPGYRGYPPLPHSLLAYLDRRHWAPVGRLLNIAFEVAGVAVVMVLANLLLRPTGSSSTGWLSPPATLGLLYSTSPLLHPVTARLQGIGGRTLGPLLTLVYVSFLGSGLLLNNPAWYAPCLGIGLAIFLSSQFGMQVLTATSVGLSLAYRDPTPLVVLAITLGIGCLIPQIDLIRLLLRKFAHYRWYCANLQRISTGQRNRLRDLILLPVYLFREPRVFLQTVFYRSSLIILLYSAVPLTLLAYWLATAPGIAKQLWSDPVAHYAMVLSLIALVCAALTATGPLRFLGEAERYIEYMLAPSLFLFVTCAERMQVSGETILGIVLLQIAVILGHFLWLMALRGDLQRQLTTCKDPELQEVASFLKSQGTPRRTVTVPTKLSCALAVEVDDARHHFYYDVLREPGRGLKYMEEDCPHYGFVRPDVEHFARRYNADTLVVEKAAVKRAVHKGIHYSFQDADLLYENAMYAVYQLCSTACNSHAQFSTAAAVDPPREHAA